MSSHSLWQLLKAHPLALVASIALHLLLIVLLSISLMTSEVPQPAAVEKQTIKAEVVDAAQVDAEIEKLKQAELKKQQDALAQQQQIEREKKKLRKQLDDEKNRLAKLKQEQRELKLRKQKEQQEEKKRLAEQERKRKQEAEREQRLEAERKRAEQEKKRLAEAEAERQRKAEEAKRKADEERRKAEEQRQQRLAAEAEQRRVAEEAELKLRLAEEERRVAAHNDMLKSLRTQYVKLIEQKVERNWLRPPSIQAGQSCEVYVRQTALGDVISVNLQACNNDVAFRNSIERAVWKASPLPPPPNPEVFDNEIRFTFRPQT